MKMRRIRDGNGVKMKLYFHIGLNKAGSSYVQELLSFNETRLLKEGVFYPDPKVVAGVGAATDGNALPLTLSVRSRKEQEAVEFLSGFVERAREKGCHSLLLSNESMYHSLVLPHNIELFRRVCRRAGIEDVKLLIIFRDPVQHAISAYNHRAGFHDMPDFPDWVRNGFDYDGPDYVRCVTGYEFWKEVVLFEENLHKQDHFELCTASQSKPLKPEVERFVGVALNDMDKKVSNPSVTCAEGRVLALLRNVDPDAARKLRNRLKDLARDQKAPDGYLREAYEEEAFAQSERIGDTLLSLRRLLGDEAFWSKPNGHDLTLADGTGRPYLLLSEEQLSEIVMFLISYAPKRKRA